ncbi:hypothetical protein BD626DRAFT_542082 [Schizophyllum amplum]|uniref:Uncharacterized protein n=1 Tax=Schizophyllum amplum TaxID=97359 RepID=A0A550BSU9_9AGAR|nr:hypothetical protein BD626DRAFT_542082 [Auriculariopsis ampla]
MHGKKGICDGAISHDGRRLAVANSWVLDVEDLYVDANRLPDCPWEGRGQPLRVWWPQWTSEEIFVAYTDRGICLFGTSGGPSGYVKRFIPTFTSDRGTSMDLYTADTTVLLARVCPGSIEIIELDTTVVLHRFSSPSINSASTTTIFAPGSGFLLSATHGNVTCISYSGGKAQCHQLLDEALPEVTSIITASADVALVAPIRGNVLMWTNVVEAALSDRSRAITLREYVGYSISFLGGLFIFIAICVLINEVLH